MLKCPPAILTAFPCSWKGPSRIHLISSFWSVMCHFYHFGLYKFLLLFAPTGMLDRWMFRLVEALTKPNARSAYR